LATVIDDIIEEIHHDSGMFLILLRHAILLLQVFRNPFDFGIWNNWKILLGLVEGR